MASLQAQQFRRLADVVAGFLDLLEYVFALVCVARLLQRRELLSRAGAGLVGQWRQMLPLDAQHAGVEDHHPLDHVLQLAHIARPVVLSEGLQRLVGDLHARPSILAPELAQKLASQQRYVLLALPERRHKERNNIEPIEEVLAEVTLGDLFFEVLVC